MNAGCSPEHHRLTVTLAAIRKTAVRYYCHPVMSARRELCLADEVAAGEGCHWLCDDFATGRLDGDLATGRLTTAGRLNIACRSTPALGAIPAN